MKKIILYNKIPEFYRKKLKKKYFVYEFDKEQIVRKDDRFINIIKGIEGIIGSKLPIDETFLKDAPNLKVVSNISVGYDNLNLDDLNYYNVLATNISGVLNKTVSELILGLMFSIARRIPEMDKYVKGGNWTSEKISTNYFGIDLFQKKIGILGLGNIGLELAKMVSAGLGMKIIYHNRKKRNDIESVVSAEYVTIDKLFSSSDFLIVLVPLNNNTYKMIDEKLINKMKKDAFLIGASRGGIINEEHLLKAVEEKKIAGACLDVYEKEPLKTNSKLLLHDNIITLPHIGSATQRTRNKMIELAINNLDLVLEGKVPLNAINLESIERKE